MIPWQNILIGAVGAILGGIIVTLFGPVLQPAASYLNRSIWEYFGNFNSPDPEAYILINTDYKDGSSIKSFPDETWSDSYELVEFYVQNTSPTPLNDVRAVLYFDGIVENSTLTDSSYQGAEVRPISDAEARDQTGNTTTQVSSGQGAMEVFIARLPPKQLVRVKFLIETDHDDIKHILYPENKPSIVNYRWEFHDVRYANSKQIENKSKDE